MQQAETPHVPRPMFGLLLRVGAVLAFSTLLMLVKLAGDNGIALPEVMFWRQVVTVPSLLLWLWWAGRMDLLRTRRPGAHFGRAAVGMTNMVFNFGAAMLLPLAVSTTIGFTTPLFAVLLAALVLREHVGPWRWTAVALGFAGVLVIAQPTGDVLPPLGVAAGLVAAFMIAVINYQIRDLGKTEHPLTTVFWFGVFGTAVTATVLPFFATAHTWEHYVLLFGIGAFGTAGQLFLTASLRHGAVASLVVIDYTALVWATIYGWAIWDRLPPAATWLGAPLIVGAGLVIAWRERRLAIERAAAVAHD